MYGDWRDVAYPILGLVGVGASLVVIACIWVYLGAYLAGIATAGVFALGVWLEIHGRNVNPP